MLMLATIWLVRRLMTLIVPSPSPAYSSLRLGSTAIPAGPEIGGETLPFTSPVVKPFMMVIWELFTKEITWTPPFVRSDTSRYYCKFDSDRQRMLAWESME